MSRGSKLGLFIFSVLTFYGCDQGSGYSDDTRYTYDTASITIPTNALDFYPKSTINKDGNLFVGYNYVDHSVDLLDIGNNEFVKKISLQKDGPEKISSIGHLFIRDSILIIYSQPEWILLDTTGHFLKRFTFEKVEKDLQNKYVIDGGFKLDALQNPYLSAGNILYINLFPIGFEINSPEFYDNPPFISIDLESLDFEVLPIIHPEEVFQNGIYYGLLDKPSPIVHNDLIIYSYPNHSSIYQYNLSNSTLRSSSIESNLIPNVIDVRQSSNIRDIYKASAKTDRYYPLKIDESGDFLYRVIRVESNVEKNRLIYHFQIINAKTFELLEEIPLDDKIAYPYDFFPTKRGIFFQLEISQGNKLDFSYVILARDK